jgi:DNA-binding CsgD family transcriptional regulator
METSNGQLARRAFDCITEMKRAQSAGELSAATGRIFGDLGLPYYALARFFRADRTPDVSVLAGEFHPEWSQRYMASRYVRHSHIARELLKTRDSYSWEDVMRRRQVDEAQKKIKNEAGEIGLTDGMFTPVRWGDGSFAAVVLAGAKPDLEDSFVRNAAEVLSSYYAVESRRLNQAAPSAAQCLSSRQRECLAWVRAGKSSTVIGEILGLSAQTVDEHVREASRKLGVRSRTQAVVEACLAGLID